jgi:hypothetical protein
VNVNHVNHVAVCRIELERIEDNLFCCLASSSSQWYQWNTAQPHTRLCAECWSYYKKLGGLKYPKKSGENFIIVN